MAADLPYVVLFGAGAIGRGFFGQLFADAGFALCFIDIDESLVIRLARDGEYGLTIANRDSVHERWIGPASAWHTSDSEAIAHELAGAAFAATAVGVRALPAIAAAIADGIARRAAVPDAVPLNIIIGENAPRAAAALRDLVAAHLPETPSVAAFFAENVGFVDASVGRMVIIDPPKNPEEAAVIRAEAYAQLPIDADAWRGDHPSVPGLQLVRPFAGYVARKLFVHNGGHALLAFGGLRRGHEFIWPALEDSVLATRLDAFWHAVNRALFAEYGLDIAELEIFENDLRQRFASRLLGDTCARVARDPIRKLAPDERLLGARALCLRHGIDTTPIDAVIDDALAHPDLSSADRAAILAAIAAS